MREKIKDKGRLEHIVSVANVLLCNKGKYSLEDVCNDPIIFFGFVKHVEIIGEAVSMLTKEFRGNHPEVEWDVIEKMRHVLVHGYYTIKPEQVWQTIEDDIEPLKDKIESILQKEIDID